MKISGNWLAEYVDVKRSPAELADALTKAGIEVEAITHSLTIPDGVVVGEILEKKPHPDADKLSVCAVSDGENTLQVVCGAPNCEAGMKAPLATIGTVFADPENNKEFVIKKTKLRGVESFGMLCSAKELGLSDDHSGLLALANDAAVGAPVAEIIDGDVVYDLEITPNRPDLLSHWGVARDLAALTGETLTFPAIALPNPTDGADANLVTVDDAELCPRYTARIIRGVTVKESPDWLKDRLTTIGLRPINNVVDVTNFVLHELGHPLHAFDLDLLAEKRIVVRRARDGEELRTLDESDVELRNSQLVIADAERPVALAGVMGGEATGVTESTRDLLLESAVFNAPNIRSTSRELDVSSDSSYRFERGVDVEMAATASDRAAKLILELAGGELASELVDVNAPPPKRQSITCRFDRVTNLLGISTSGAEITDILRRLGLDVIQEDESHCVVVPPSYRGDLEREADLAEEVMRIHGLDDVPAAPMKAIAGGSILDDDGVAVQNLRAELTGLGLNECVTYTLTNRKAAALGESLEEKDLIKLANPISKDQAYLRASLFAGMLENVERNISHKNTDLALFEIGGVFHAATDPAMEEQRQLCVALTGRRHPERFSDEKNAVADFFDLKGILESLLEHRRLGEVRFAKTEDVKFANGTAAKILIGDGELGVLGQVASEFTRDTRLDHPLFIALLDVDGLISASSSAIQYQPLSQFPAVTRDVAFLAEESLEHQTVVDFIRKQKPKNLEAVELFDIFRGDSIGNNRKSMAYSLTFRNPERTLTDKEVNKAHESLRKRLASDLQVELR